MNIIAIDCGASFLKGALISEGNIIRRKEKKAPSVCVSEKILDTKHIDLLVTEFKELLRDLSDGEEEVRLCISNEMHGFLLAFEDGRAYTDYISWQKEYGKEELLDLKKYEEYILHSGMPLRAGLPSSNLAYLWRHDYIGIEQKLYFYTLGDYLIRTISGVQPFIHPTNAAATGLFDLTTNTWNDTYIDKICGKNIVFPQISSREIICIFNNTKIYCKPAIGDQQAALLGSGCEEDDISFNLGTGAQVSKVISEISFSRDYQTRPFFGGKFIKTIPHLPSGRAINVYVRFVEDILKAYGVSISEDELWKVLLDQIQIGESTSIKCDMSFFENPLTDTTKGAINEISEYDLKFGNLMKSVVKTMNENFLLAQMRLEPNRSIIKRIIFTGGVARKIAAIRAGIVEVFPANIEVMIVKDETLLGLYYYSQLSE